MALVRLNVTNPDATNQYLRSLTGKEIGLATPLDNLNRLGEISQGNFTYVSVDLAASMGFGFANASVSQSSRVMTFDYASTANQHEVQDNGIDSWTYGAGYRIGVLASNTEASLQLGLSALAATATLQNKQVSIQVLRYGMPEGPVIALPNFAKFDVEAYGMYIQWQTDVIKYMRDNRASLTPIRIYAALSVDIDQYFFNSAPLRYALRRIQDKQTLKQSLDKLRQTPVDHVAGHEAEIRAVYARITQIGEYLNEQGVADSQPISDNSKMQAERWIQQYDDINNLTSV